MKPDDLLLVGRVARAHGNRGQVIVNPETDFADQRFTVGAIVLAGSGADPRPLEITAVRFHQGRPVLAFAGVETMDEAEVLAGADLRMPAGELAPLPAGTFYRHDLVGCEVCDAHGAPIGRVVAVEGPMDRSCLVVGGAHGEVLIPLVQEICVRVDPAQRTIVVNPPEGLLELNEARRDTES